MISDHYTVVIYNAKQNQQQKNHVTKYRTISD